MVSSRFVYHICQVFLCPLTYTSSPTSVQIYHRSYEFYGSLCHRVSVDLSVMRIYSHFATACCKSLGHWPIISSKVSLTIGGDGVLNRCLSVLVTAITQYCLQRSLQSRDSSGLDIVDRLLCSLIFHCSKDEDQARAVKDMDIAFQRT